MSPAAPQSDLETRCFAVGGAVRDGLLGIDVKDRDWVVVSSTPQEMLDHGFRQVGADFPVFLHPHTHEEYALARTERKSGSGYQGFVCDFSPDVTLEEDLHRRDLTINAMAIRNKDIIDPWGGRADLKNKLLRHVSEAFSEDPLRVLRVARFAARFAPMGFTVHASTLALMRKISDSGELATLTPERVWTEWLRALNQPDADTFFDVLDACDATRTLLPELPRDRPSLNHIANPLHRYALLFAGSDQQTPCERLKIPNNFARLAKLCRVPLPANVAQACALFDQADLKRRPTQLDDYLAVMRASHQPIDRIESLQRSSIAWLAVSPQRLIEKGLTGAAIGAALGEHRRQAVEQTW